MKKSKNYLLILSLILCAMFLLPFFNNNNIAKAEQPKEVYVIIETNIYKESNIKSDILLNKVKVGTKLKLDTSFLNEMFYKISTYNIVENATVNDYGFVLISHTLDSSIQSPQKKLDTNSQIKNDNSILYTKDSNTNKYIATDIKLKKDTKVRILDGYDKNKEYTYISFQNEKNEIISLYIKTSDLLVKGINYSVIVAISTLVTCLVIISIVFGIKGKKKHKNKK